MEITNRYISTSSTLNATNNSHSTSNAVTAPPLAANTATNLLATPIAPVGGSDLFANPTLNTTNSTPNPATSSANTAGHPRLFGTRDVNVTGGLFGNSGLFGKSGTTAQSMIGASNTAGGGLFGDPIPVCKGKERLGSWLLDLFNAGLWPLSSQISLSSYQHLLNELKLIKDSNSVVPFQGGLFGTGPRCECRTCNTNLSTLMKDLSTELEDDIKPLCLVCVKNGKFTKMEGNCARESHIAEVKNVWQGCPDTFYFPGVARTSLNSWMAPDMPI